MLSENYLPGLEAGASTAASLTPGLSPRLSGTGDISMPTGTPSVHLPQCLSPGLPGLPLARSGITDQLLSHLSPVSAPGNLGPPTCSPSPSYLNHLWSPAGSQCLLWALPLGFLWSPARMTADILPPSVCS